MKRLFFLFFLLTPLFAEEEISIHLETKNQLEPVFLASFIDDHAGFSKDYLFRLQRVLDFDLNHNGSTFLVEHTRDLEQLSQRYPFPEGGNPGDWRGQGVNYVVRVSLSEQQMSVRILHLLEGSIKTVDAVPLTGDLAEDRRKIHQLADLIHKMLFGTEGIASTRFLYTIRTRHPEKKGEWLSEVWEADYDGENRREVTKLHSYCVMPTYMPGARGKRPTHFAYVCYLTGQPKIYLSPLRGKGARRLTTIWGNQIMPVFSPQSDQLAFVCDIAGTADLFLLPVTGEEKKPRQIYHYHNVTVGTPAFDPTGQRLAFVSNKNGSPRIYLMDVPPEGAKRGDVKPTLLTKFGAGCTAPSWSPDGTKIAYCSRVDGIRQIWVYDFTLERERCLTTGRGNKENPTWAPNSTHLLYNTTDADACEVYLLDTNHPHPVCLTKGKGEKRFPCWEPPIPLGL